MAKTFSERIKYGKIRKSKKIPWGKGLLMTLRNAVE